MSGTDILSTAANAPAGNSVPRRASRPWYRLHLSTWVVLVLTLGVAVLANLPGYPTVVVRPRPVPFATRGVVKHGYPWSYLERNPGMNRPWRIPDDVIAFRPGLLIADVCAALAFVSLVAACFEWWRRWRYHLWQLHVVDLLALILFAACFFALSQRATYQHRREKATAAELRAHGVETSWQQGRAGWVWRPRPSVFDHAITVISGYRTAYADSDEAPRFGDSELASVAELDRLEVIFLPGEPSTAGPLPHVEITDTGVAHLSRLKRLRVLDLSYHPVTDAGLVHLEGLKRLEYLDISGTNVTAKGVERLQRALPRLKIDGP